MKKLYAAGLIALLTACQPVPGRSVNHSLAMAEAREGGSPVSFECSEMWLNGRYDVHHCHRKAHDFCGGYYSTIGTQVPLRGPRMLYSRTASIPYQPQNRLYVRCVMPGVPIGVLAR